MNTLFEIDEFDTVDSPKWSDYAVTVSYSDDEIIRMIISLHNNGKSFDCDPTYSKGVFWQGLPQPKYKFDIAPQIDGVQQADARQLPLANGSISSLMFDPPFVAKNTQDREPNGIIEMRFSGYKSVPDLWSFYQEALIEFYRVLEVDGVLAFKCQDMVSGGKQHWSHVEIYNMAKAMGFYAKDLFILVRNNVLWSPNMENQQHARKNHSFYWVFKKAKVK